MIYDRIPAPPKKKPTSWIWRAARRARDHALTVASVVEWAAINMSLLHPYSKPCDVICRELLKMKPTRADVRGSKLYLAVGRYKFVMDAIGIVNFVLVGEVDCRDWPDVLDWMDVDACRLAKYDGERPSLAVINKAARMARAILRKRAAEDKATRKLARGRELKEATDLAFVISENLKET